MKSKLTAFFTSKFSPRQTTGADSPKLKKHKGKTKWVVGGTVLVLATVLIILRPNAAVPANIVSKTDLSELVPADIENTISATGTVESNLSHKVYSSQTYKVNDVLVEVGDYVTADQLLCVLDGSSLENQLESKEISVTNSANSSAQQVKTAKDTYTAAKDALDNGTNSSIINADSSVRTAYENWQKAQKTYNDYEATLDDGNNASLLSQDASVSNAGSSRDSAQSAYDSALSAYNDAQNALKSYTPNTADAQAAQTACDGALLDQQLKQSAYDSVLSAYEAAQATYNVDPDAAGAADALTAAKTAFDDASEALQSAKAYSESAAAALAQAKSGKDTHTQELQAACDARKATLESARKTLDQAKSSYNSAVQSRDAAYSSADTALEDYGIAVNNAYAAYQAALKSSDAAKVSAETSLQSSKNSLSSAQISANNDLAKLELSQLQENLDDTNILAGESGTVTAVYASVGSSGNGLLFVIEDTDDLIIETTVSEYDIGTVTIGMPVTIKSEATGDAEYQGTVLSIAPTSNKNAQGATDSSGDSVFAAKIKVTSADTDLRIGMSVRLKFIVEQQAQALAVPYDAVYTNAAGEDCILSIEAQGGDACLVREIPVTTGLENDISIVISGEQITEGMQIINSPDNYKYLIDKTAALSDAALPSGDSGMPMGFMGRG